MGDDKAPNGTGNFRRFEWDPAKFNMMEDEDSKEAIEHALHEQREAVSLVLARYAHPCAPAHDAACPCRH